ncbi:hypothetical protein MTO96_032035 [Rhipicephalus appendiculatus]
MKVPLISETMTEKRFFKLRNNLHIVAENSDFRSEDCLWKVHPFLELIRKRCLELAVEEECSIDEQMIPFKGQLSIKQYVKAGTVRKNRLGKCPLETKKVINKKPRGYSAEYVTSDDVVVVVWKDNNAVCAASNFVGIGDQEDVKRWDKTKREHIFVKQPEIIAKYNCNMGGVDKMDFLLSLYRTKIR